MDTGVNDYEHAVKNFVISIQGVIITQHIVLNFSKCIKKIIITLVLLT